MKMNLFSRLSEILDGNAEGNLTPPAYSSHQANRLVRAMEKELCCVSRSAIPLIAAERAVAREIALQIQNEERDEVLLERLREENSRALTIKAWVKQILRELRSGLDHARQLRAALMRWEALRAVDQVSACEDSFWKSYHRLCDLTDKRLDDLERKALNR
jgi:hypothetical protein